MWALRVVVVFHVADATCGGVRAVSLPMSISAPAVPAHRNSVFNIHEEVHMLRRQKGCGQLIRQDEFGKFKSICTCDGEVNFAFFSVGFFLE